MVSIFTRVRRARTSASLTQAELARRVGVERSAVTQWEHPNGTTPSVDHLATVAMQTGVCFEWLATGRGPRMPEEGAFDSAVAMEEFARDAIESQALLALRRLSFRKRSAAVQIIELLA